MPAGCEFICKNESCEHFNKGFTITAPWGMGDIDAVINSRPVRKNSELQGELSRQRDEGRKYCCINYPLPENEIKVEGYRVQRWCSDCFCLFESYLALNTEVDMTDEEFDEEITKQIEAIEECPKCGKDLLNFNELLEEGVDCPYCKEELFQSRWCSNEVIGDDGEK